MVKYIVTILFTTLILCGQAQNPREIKGSGYILTQQREVDFFDRI